jgi:hypothetical protein
MTRHHLLRISVVSPSRVQRLMLGAACCVMLGTSLTACTTAHTYNPAHLQEAQFERVSSICQNVMGLDPNETLQAAGHFRGPSVNDETSHYRACVLSLSESLQGVVDAQLTQSTDAACAAKGLAPGSPDLALCVLNRLGNHSASGDSQTSAVAQSGDALPQALTSYDRASVHDQGQLEGLACASLGLNPAENGFANCVQKINQALHTIDYPII